MKLKCDEPLSNFAFNFNLRHYTLAANVLAFRHEVGRCRFTVSNPVLKAPLVSEYSLETNI